MKDASQYSEHKKAALALTAKCMSELGPGYEAMWKGFKGKKDDLADAFLQGVCSSLEPTKAKAPKRKRDTKKKPEKNMPLFDDS
jgi:hypothetical protein